MLHFYFPSAVSGSIGDKLGFADPKRYSSKFEFYDIFRQISARVLILKAFLFVYV